MVDHTEKTPEWTDAQAEAAEYALGLLQGDALRAAERRMKGDAAFRTEVARWQTDFADLAEGVAPVVPPAHLRAAIEGRLFDAPTGWRHRLGQQLTSRRGFLAGLVGATAVVVIAVTLPNFMTPEQVMTANLAAEDGSLVVTARIAGDVLSIERLVPAAAEGRDMELWLIAADGVPKSIGVMPDDASASMTLTPLIFAALAEGATLAVSDEPTGGSPTGQPTGAVLAAGTIVLG